MAEDRLAGHLLADPGRAGLFCDFDGTLTPIVADPAASRLPGGSAALLRELAAALGVVAVVSGRPAAFLGSHVAVPGVRLLGVYGLEEWRDGRAVPRAEAAAWAETVAAVRERLPGLVAHLDGVRVEDKGLSVAVHWRNAPDRHAAEAQVGALTRRLAAESGLAREPGKLVEELRPPVDWDKGAAVRAVAAEAGLERLAYVGDDRGDLAAFAAVHDLGGLCVAVAHGPETPQELTAAADAVVVGHEGVTELLRTLAGALTSGAARPRPAGPRAARRATPGARPDEPPP